MARRQRSAEDPLAADRRTLVIGGVAMVALIAVGVTSAALFTGSACDDLVPDELEAGVVGSDVRQVIDEALAELDDERRDELVAAVSDLAERLGPVLGAAEVGDAQRLTPVTSGRAALGGETTVLADDGPAILGAAAFDEPAVLVGGGATLYALALANETTGQVDAVQPFRLGLEAAGGCLDAATVNVPFAFHLDAGGGDLLLLRVEEDGDEPELELRGRRGARWQAPLEIVTAPPGVLGERLTARLGTQLVVAARRVLPGEGAAAVTAVGRADGAIRWTVDPQELPLAEGPVWLEVLTVTEETVLLAASSEDERDESVLLALDAADGSLRWADGSTGDRAQVVAAPTATVELVRVGGRIELREIDDDTGQRSVLAAVAADSARAAVTSKTVIAALGEGVVAVDRDDGDTIHLDVAVRDVVVGDEDRTSVLFPADDGGIVVVFGST